MKDLDSAPYGWSRYAAEAMMAQRAFAKFHIDVGVGDVVLDHSLTKAFAELRRFYATLRLTA